jgi:hypothetical protein
MTQEKSEITVSHADLDAALEKDAAAKVAAEQEPAKEPEQEPEPPEKEPEQALSSDPDQNPEPEPEPEPEEDELPPEPDDHKERSRLGRKVAGLEENINRLVGLIETLATKKSEPEPEDPDDDEPVFMTKKQLREFVKAQAKDAVVQTETEKTKAQRAYESSYVSHVRKIGSDLLPKQLEAVFKEMFDNHNEVIHKIPEVDADINFHRAVASLAAKAKPAPKVIPLKKDDPKNLGGPADTNIAPKKVAAPKLDEHAAALVKHLGWNEDKVSAALSGEAPLSLRGKI